MAQAIIILKLESQKHPAAKVFKHPAAKVLKQPATIILKYLAINWKLVKGWKVRLVITVSWK